MRPISRSLRAVLVGLVVASCVDAPAGPGIETRAVSARLVLRPTFSPSASAAYAALAAKGSDVTDVRIVIRDLNGAVALDTVVVFPAGTDVLSIELPLVIRGSEQQFDARIELRDATGVVQFSSAQRVTARDATLPSVPVPPLALVYVGPGATVRTVSLGTSEASILSGAVLAMIASGVDSTGRAVAGVEVTWTSSDTAIARVASTGPLTALLTSRGPRGVVTLTARTTGGVLGTSRITVIPRPSRLAIVGGGGQTSSAFTILPTPFTVELLGTDNLPISGRLVTFRAVSGGEVTSPEGSTDAAGRARTAIKLGRTAGTYTYEASSTGVSAVTVTATATAAIIGPPTQLVALSPLPQSFKVGVVATQTFSAQLADANGNYVRQAGVQLTATMVVSPGGATSSLTVQSDANGVLTLPIPAFSQAGSVTITLSSPVMTNLPFGTFPVVP